MKKVKVLLMAIVAISMSNLSYAQWTTSGSNIYNTNLITGKIGIGKVPDANGAVSGTSPYLYSNDTPFLQIYGLNGHTSPPHSTGRNSVVSIGAQGVTTKLGLGVASQYIYPSMQELSFIKADGKMAFFSSELWVDCLTKFANKVVITNGASINNAFNINQPAGYNLYVTGGILTEKLKVAVKNSGNWADYVFDKDYKLLSLGEVEAYVLKNKHLPGVPSAEEVVKEGIDMATMDAKLLEKIEELTLYMIEMKKENEEMKKKNEALEVLVNGIINSK